MKFLPGGKKRAARRFLFIITASGKNEKRLTRILQKSAYFCFFPAAMREIICAFEAGGTEKRGAKAILYGTKKGRYLFPIASFFPFPGCIRLRFFLLFIRRNSS
jgi:hypothetical protein